MLPARLSLYVMLPARLVSQVRAGSVSQVPYLVQYQRATEVEVAAYDPSVADPNKCI